MVKPKLIEWYGSDVIYRIYCLGTVHFRFADIPSRSFLGMHPPNARQVDEVMSCDGKCKEVENLHGRCFFEEQTIMAIKNLPVSKGKRWCIMNDGSLEEYASPPRLR